MYVHFHFLSRRWKKNWNDLNNSSFNILLNFYLHGVASVPVFFVFFKEWYSHGLVVIFLTLPSSCERARWGRLTAALWLYQLLSSAQPGREEIFTDLSWKSWALRLLLTASLLLSRKISPSTWRWRAWCLMSLLGRVSGLAFWVLTSGELGRGRGGLEGWGEGGNSGQVLCPQMEGTGFASVGQVFPNNANLLLKAFPGSRFLWNQIRI